MLLTRASWFAAVRCRVRREGRGYGIGDVEDLHRRFPTEEEARVWVEAKRAAVEA
jgi:hypothetical protein